VIAVLLSANGPDQAQASRALEGEDGQEIGLLKVDMDFAIGCRSGSVHVGDVEHAGIRPPGEACSEGLTNRRLRAVAPSETGCLAHLL
jgi:hypothetical protein